MKTLIYQIYYSENQKPQLDPSFIPYDNSGKSYPFNYEYAVFFDLFKKVNWDEASLLGTVSWKFKQKTGLLGSEFTEHIRKNPNYDVYFVNPFPFLCHYKSVWEQGQNHHPNLIKIAENLLAAVGYDLNILKNETPPSLTAFCNYWVGNKKFWDAYVAYLTPIWDYVLSHDNEITKSLGKNADLTINAPYLPFIFERLFSTFLASGSWRVSSLPISEKKLKESFYLRPIAQQILNLSHAKTHEEVQWADLVALKTMSWMRIYLTKLYR
jgi:hypothetical protein